MNTLQRRVIECCLKAGAAGDMVQVPVAEYRVLLEAAGLHKHLPPLGGLPDHRKVWVKRAVVESAMHLLPREGA